VLNRFSTFGQMISQRFCAWHEEGAKLYISDKLDTELMER